MNISPLDWLVISVYFVVVTAIGPIVGYKARRTGEYFLGGASTLADSVDPRLARHVDISLTWVCTPGQRGSTRVPTFALCNLYRSDRLFVTQ